MATIQTTLVTLGRWLGLLPHPERRKPRVKTATSLVSKSRSNPGRSFNGNMTVPVDPDLLALVEFGNSPRTVLPLMSVANPQVRPACRRLAANAGSTELDKGLESAMRLLMGVDRKLIRRVVLISDGEPTCAPAPLVGIAGRMGKEGIRLDCIGVGPPAGGQLLRTLAKLSYRGRHYSAGTFKALASAVLAHAESGCRHRFRGATVLLIDASGSMNGAMPQEPTRSRIQACREAAEAFVATQTRLYGHKVR